MFVKDVMKENPFTINPDASVLDAKELMRKNKVTKLPVVDKGGALVGIITANDLQKASPSQATSLDMYEVGYLLSKLKIEKIMVKNVKTTSLDTPVEDAAQLMTSYNIGSLVVVKDDILVGIVTETDLFTSFIKMFSAKTHALRAAMVLDEHPGVLSKLVDAIAQKNGNIVSLVTSDAADENFRKVTIKVTGVSTEDLSAMIFNVGGTLEDIRSV